MSRRLTVSGDVSPAGWRFTVGDWCPGVLAAVMTGVCGCGPLGGYGAPSWGVAWATDDESDVLLVGSRGGSLWWGRIAPTTGAMYVGGHEPGSTWSDPAGTVRYHGEGLVGSGMDAFGARIRAGRLQLGDPEGRVWQDEQLSSWLRDLPAYTKTSLFTATNAQYGASAAGVLS